MRNAAGNPLRTMFRGAAGLFTTATTVYSPRVSRGLVLQVSLLFFIRAMLELIPLPLTSLLGDTVLPLVLNGFQASIGIAAISTYMNSDGWFGSIGRRIFTPSDSAFIKLYATLVLVLGPVFAMAESAVVVFESMKISRDLEDRMSRVSSSADSNPWRSIILVVSLTIYSGLIGTAVIVYRLNGGVVLLPAIILGFAFVYFVLAFAAEDSNIMEGALLAAYSVVLVLVGVVEELDSKNSSVVSYFSGVLDPPKGEYRALILILSSLGALLTLPRAPELLQVVLFSAEAAAQSQETSVELKPAPMLLAPMQTMTASVPPLGLGNQAAGPAQIVMSQVAAKPKWKSGISMAVAVVVVTFRVLVWSGSLSSGEYYPVFSRIAQLAMTLVVYNVFIKMEAADNEEKQRHRAEMAARSKIK